VAVTYSLFAQYLLNTQCLRSGSYILTVCAVSVKHSVFAQWQLHTHCLRSGSYTLTVCAVSLKHSVFAWNTATGFIYENNRAKWMKCYALRSFPSFSDLRSGTILYLKNFVTGLVLLNGVIIMLGEEYFSMNF